MDVKLVWVTPNAEAMIGKIARVSNPANQDNPNVAGLLKYCIRQKHWSIFEQACMSVEIETTRAISAQIIRHRSFNYQEFSLRYAEAIGFETVEARSQDLKNRQNSNDNMSEETKEWFEDAQRAIQSLSSSLYQEALDFGVAKEQARYLLPLSTKTRLYMTGNLRSFITYLQVRTDPSTQKEHRDIAEAIKVIFIEQFPIISEALDWTRTNKDSIVE
jgi:thymidylate synthase (FAD)